MIVDWPTAEAWAVHAAAAGGVVLWLGWVVGRLTAAPARRLVTTSWALRGAVIAAGLSLLPAWWTLPLPRWGVPLHEFVAVELTPGGAEELVPTADRSGDFAAVLYVSQEVGTEHEADLAPTRFETDAAADAAPVAGAPAVRADLASLVLTAYVVTALGLFVQHLAGHVGLWRLRRSARPAPQRVRRVCSDLLDEGMRWPAVLVSERLGTPVCFGILRPTVVLPADLAAEADEGQLRWVLAHELDHLRRGDPATALWAGVARSLYFFVPWFWAVRRDLALAQEYLADAAAAAGRPADYAEFLVNLTDDCESRHGRSTRGPLLAAHAVTAGRSDLFRRVNMILNARIDHRCPRRWAVVAAGGLLSAAVLLSGLGWAVADEDTPQPKAERKDAAPQADDRGDPAGGPERVRELKRKIGEAVQAGDGEEVRRLVNQLERALLARPPRPERNPDELMPPPDAPAPPRPPVAGGPPGRGGPAPDGRGFGGPAFGGGGFGGPPQDGRGPGGPPRGIPGFAGAPGFPPDEARREAFEHARRALETQLEALKDRPEMREGLTKALDELRSQFDNPDSGPGGFGPFGPGFFGGAGGGMPGFPGGMMAGGPPPGVRFGVGIGRVPEVLAEQLDVAKDRGLLVANVQPGTPAEKAGLKRNDVILQYAGKDVPSDERKFIEMVNATKPGEKVDLVVLRKGKKETLTAELPEPPRPQPRRAAGPPGLGEPGFPGRGRVALSTMSASIDNDKFTVTATRDGTKYEVAGRMEDGRPAPDSIAVTEGDNRTEYANPREVPEEHRGVIRQLLSNLGWR